jgi:hypothetical protein
VMRVWMMEGTEELISRRRPLQGLRARSPPWLNERTPALAPVSRLGLKLGSGRPASITPSYSNPTRNQVCLYSTQVKNFSHFAAISEKEKDIDMYLFLPAYMAAGLCLIEAERLPGGG